MRSVTVLPTMSFRLRQRSNPRKPLPLALNTLIYAGIASQSNRVFPPFPDLVKGGRINQCGLIDRAEPMCRITRSETMRGLARLGGVVGHEPQPETNEGQRPRDSYGDGLPHGTGPNARGSSCFCVHVNVLFRRRAPRPVSEIAREVSRAKETRWPVTSSLERVSIFDNSKHSTIQLNP